MLTRRALVLQGLTGLGAAALLPRGARGLQVPAASPAASPAPAPGPADAVYRRSLVLDILTTDGPDLDARAATAAGLSGAVVDLRIFPRNFPGAVAALAAWNATIEKRDTPFLLVRKAADLEEAKRQGRFGVVLACQDAAILDSSTSSINDYNLVNLRLFHTLGLRVLQLTHNERNAVGDSFREKSDAGLSRLGEKVVAEMNSLGMVVDLSHCGDKTTLEAIRLSAKPCAVTHAGCRALYPTPRNKSDEAIRALADGGGVMGIYNMSMWLTDRGTTSVADVLDHVDHVVKVGGIEHVSFGSDGPVSGVEDSPEDELAGMQAYVKKNLGLPGAERIPRHVTVRALDNPRRLAVLADGLAARGYKEDAIEKFLGANFARVFRAVCG